MPSEGRFLIGVLVVVGVMLLGGSWQSSGLFSQETAGWAQFIGSMAAVGAAIWVPWRLDRQRRQEEERALMTRRRAAWKTMHALVKLLGRKELVRKGEIESIAKVLDKLDLSIFPERAVSVLVGLHNRMAMAAAAVDGAEVVDGYVKFSFEEAHELANLAVIQEDMGMPPPMKNYYLGRRSPFLFAKRQIEEDTGENLLRPYPLPR